MTDKPDNAALSRINELVAEEKALREQLQHGKISESEENKRLRQLEIELDLVGGADRGVAGIAAGLAQGAALPQQVPALVEFDLELPQPLVLLGLADLAVL
jgi:hypothetical protein